MSDREPAEKRTVEHSDELLRKSRRLIDELEFILDKLEERPPKAERIGRAKGDQQGDDARSG